MCTECRWPLVLEQIEAALARVQELPDEAEDFGSSVDEKLHSMHEWIEKAQHATGPQIEAIENMAAGIERWIR